MNSRKPSDQLVNLVTQTVKDIAKEKGYLSYPKKTEVVMVLTAWMIVSEAIRRVNQTID